MKLKVHRATFTEDSTIGILYLDGKQQCYTLEDKVRPKDEKVPGKTAIPAGTYKVVLDNSVRFQRLMPHILDVPDFSGIRIHWGNTAEDTEGCILVGQEYGSNEIMNSRAAFNPLFEKLKNATDEITIEIE